MLERFLDVARKLNTCFVGDNVLDRARDAPKGPRGNHVIGNLHVRGPQGQRRGWLWDDTGELLDGGLGDARIIWLIASGPRRQGHPSDLQEARKDILHAADDAIWLPTAHDYKDLFEALDDDWLDRAVVAVAHAVSERPLHAGEHRSIGSIGLELAIFEGSTETIQVEIGVFQEYRERFVTVAMRRDTGAAVSEADALALATVAFPADLVDEIHQVARRTHLSDHGIAIDPGRVWAWTATVEG